MVMIYVFHAIVFLMAQLITIATLRQGNVNAIRVYMAISAMPALISLLS